MNANAPRDRQPAPNIPRSNEAAALRTTEARRDFLRRQAARRAAARNQRLPARKALVTNHVSARLTTCLMRHPGTVRASIPAR